MHAPSDAHLLASWLECQSENGFRALVERYSGLVYMTAKRTCADDTMAREASHLTFITLARKATSLAQRDSLGGWLHVTSMMHAKNLLQHRKREALKLERLGAYLQASHAGHASDSWRRLEPVLDQALAALSKSDREAILLRYYRSLSVREVAAILTVSVDAAQKRLDRAVERLRRHLGRQGVAAGSSLGAVLLAGFASDVQAGTVLAPSFASKALKAGPAAGSSVLMGLLLALFAKKAAVAALILLAGGALAAAHAHAHRNKLAPPASVARNLPMSQTAGKLKPVKTAASAGADERRRLEEKYGKQRTLLSQSVTDQAIQITAYTQTLLGERLLPAMEQHKSMPRPAKLDPSLELSDDQRRKLGTLSAGLMRRQLASSRETLERIRNNPLPVMEILLMGDACARGEMAVEEYESRRNALAGDLVVLENPVELGDKKIMQFGSQSPFDDETYMNGLRELLSPSQLETFVRATTSQLSERANAAVAQQKFLNFSTMPPVELTRLAKQADGSLAVLEGSSEDLQTWTERFDNGR